MIIPEEILSQLTDEQKTKIGNAKAPEEFLAIAKEIGYELSDEQLNAMSGGWCLAECSEDSCSSDYCGDNF